MYDDLDFLKNRSYCTFCEKFTQLLQTVVATGHSFTALTDGISTLFNGMCNKKMLTLIFLNKCGYFIKVSDFSHIRYVRKRHYGFQIWRQCQKVDNKKIWFKMYVPTQMRLYWAKLKTHLQQQIDNLKTNVKFYLIKDVLKILKKTNAGRHILRALTHLESVLYKAISVKSS